MDRKSKHQERGKKKKEDVRGLRKWEHGRRGPERRRDKTRQALTQVAQELLTQGRRDSDCSERRQVRSQQIIKLDHSHSGEEGDKKKKKKSHSEKVCQGTGARTTCQRRKLI